MGCLSSMLCREHLILVFASSLNTAYTSQKGVPIYTTIH